MLFVFAGCFLFSSGRGVHPSEKLDERGAEMFDQAGKHIRMGRFTEAESMLMRIAGEYPAFFRARRELQEMVVREKGLVAALEAARISAGKERTPMTLTLLARLVDDPDEALALLDEALVLDDGYVWARYGAAFLLLKHRRVNEYETARRHLENVLSNAPSFRGARRLLIESLHRLGDGHEEARQLKLYLEDIPSDADMLSYADMRFAYADLLCRKLGDTDKALEQLDKVLDVEPDRVDALLLKGVVLTQAGRYTEAENVYLGLSEDHPYSLFNLGLLNMNHLDAPGRAKRYFDEYLDYSGENAEDRSFLDQKILVPTYLDNLERERL